MLSGDLFSLKMIYFNTAEKWEKECFFRFFLFKKLIFFGGVQSERLAERERFLLGGV